MRTPVISIALATVLAVAGCGDQPEQGTGNEPELLLVTMVQRGELPDPEPRTVELTDGTTLRVLAPPAAFVGGKLPELPPRDQDESRYAALLAGCQETRDPELHRQGDAWVARFPEAEDPVNCVVADHYVAVWDVDG